LRTGQNNLRPALDCADRRSTGCNWQAYLRFGCDVGNNALCRILYRRPCDHAGIDPSRGGNNWADYRPRRGEPDWQGSSEEKVVRKAYAGLPPPVALMPGMGSSKRQKPRTITRGFCLMSAGTTHLDPQGWALRAVHSHNPHGKV